MANFQLSLVCLALFLVVPSYARIANAEWRDIKHSSELMLHQVEPVGKEGNEYVYLCRGYPYGKDWVPGKLKWETGKVLCSVAYSDKEVTNHLNGYQIMSTAPGAASWVQVDNTLSKTAMVYGGTNANKSKHIFVCRGWVQGDLISGAYHNNENSCYIVKDNQVVKVQQNLESC